MRGCNQEWLTALGFRIEFPPNQVTEAEGSVGVCEESIQRRMALLRTDPHLQDLLRGRNFPL